MADSYAKLLGAVVRIWDSASSIATTESNRSTLAARWEIGRRIAQAEHDESGRGAYGRRIIDRLARDLGRKYGAGFGARNLQQMRKLHRLYDSSSLTVQLSWSHYARLLEVKEERQRLTLEKRSLRENWSVEELGRQIQLLALREGETRELPRPKGQFHLYAIKRAAYGSWKPQRPLIDCGFHAWLDLPTPGVHNVEDGQIVRARRSQSGWRFERSEAGRNQIYLYVANPYRLIDGDTIIVHIDAGFNLHLRQTLRLSDVDAPDLQTKEGKRTARYVQQSLRGCSFVVIQTRRNDRYGRYLARILYARNAKHPQAVYEEGRYLNQELLNEGLAAPA